MHLFKTKGVPILAHLNDTGKVRDELAKKAGTTQAVVARLETGEDSRIPSLGLIYKLLQAANARLELNCVYGKNDKSAA